MHKKQYFNLAELVVVMVLMAIGIVLFFTFKNHLPSMSGSRPKARRISCTSNLKQMGLAIRMYSQDNKEELLFPALMSITKKDYTMRNQRTG